MMSKVSEENDLCLSHGTEEKQPCSEGPAKIDGKA
jgi:hypothetical protein